jgi:MFS family permease
MIAAYVPSSWLSENQTLVWVLAGVSVASLLLAALLLPRIVAKLPPDHFKERRRKKREGGLGWRIGKNVLGVVFLALGVLLLFLPGQGLLTLLVGVMLVDFPGKHRIERWIVMRPGIRKFLNRMRTKRGQPEFQL